MTTLKDQLTAAIDAKNNDVKSFVWKKARQSDGTQEEIKLMDASPEELNTFYNHCYSMLYSDDKANPGRYTLLDIIQEQRNKCCIELFLRKLEEKDSPLAGGKAYPRQLYCQDILSCINQNREIFPQNKLGEISIGLITGGLPRDFDRISISQVIDGCLYQLGMFNNKHITFSFILELGIFLTPEEMKEFTEKDANGKTRSKLEVIKERLNINPNVRLTVKPTGLNFTELRAMINLRSKKYSDLTTDQLNTLRNKVLFRLEQKVNYHIDQWEERIRQLKKVAEERGITLTVAE